MIDTTVTNLHTLSEMPQFPEWLEYHQLAKLEDSYSKKECYRLTCTLICVHMVHKVVCKCWVS